MSAAASALTGAAAKGPTSGTRPNAAAPSADEAVHAASEVARILAAFPGRTGASRWSHAGVRRPMPASARKLNANGSVKASSGFRVASTMKASPRDCPSCWGRSAVRAKAP